MVLYSTNLVFNALNDRLYVVYVALYVLDNVLEDSLNTLRDIVKTRKVNSSPDAS
jgi:hypothetical protein